MKHLRKFLSLLLTLIIAISPILETYAVTTNNVQQIKYNYTSAIEGEGGVKIWKTIAPTELENYFDITLKVQTKELAKEQDVAIVVVMDVSNSMIDEKTSDGTTRLRAALTAGKTFINDFATYSASTAATRKLGYVAFNTNATKVFDVQDIKTTQKATELATEMENETKKIVVDIDNVSSYKQERFIKYTNIEAGLKMAEDMLYNDPAVKDIENKYIILISDGFPTTYIESGYNGYKNRMDSVSFTATKDNHNLDGVFYDEVSNKSVLYGCDYSDKGAKKAQELATKIKNRGTTIYSIGTGLTDDAKTVDYYADYFGPNANFSTVDRTSKKYVVGQTVQNFKEWLGGTGNINNPGIGSGYSAGYYFDTANLNDLKKAYAKIFEDIKEMSEASWVTNDPMNSESDETLKAIIGFLGIYDKTNKKENIKSSVVKGDSSNNTASYNSKTDTITWDLKNSNYKTVSQSDGGQTTNYYEYELKYRIRLKNENGIFIPNNSYQTNGITTLSYIVKKSNNQPEIKSLNYKIPKIEGYLGTLTFNKISNYGNTPLANTKFKLVHDKDNCSCLNEQDHLDPNYYLESTSNANGVVTFTKVPSGHIYKLIETVTDEYHELANSYNVEVSYGKVSTNITNNTIINNYKSNDLTIKKIVNGVSTTKAFNFTIEASYKDAPLTGTYEITKNYNSKDTTEQIVFTDGKASFTLKHNETATIKNIPYKTSITIKESNNDGFVVKYQINDGDYIKYDVNSLNSELLNDDMKVTFINSSGYVMPATGSSGILILAIMGSLLLIVPVLYISINVIKKAD